MTIVIPVWLESIIRLGLIAFFIGIYNYVAVKFFKLFKIEENRWIKRALVLFALVGTLFMIDHHHRELLLQKGDLVIKGNGEIVEAACKKVITTDKDTFVYNGEGIPFQDRKTYTFATKDGQLADVEILISFHEIDAQTIIKAFQVYNEMVEPYDKSFINFFSSLSYYDEIVEKKLKEQFRQKIGNINKEELSEEMLVEIIENFESIILDEHDRNMFSFHLN